MTTATDEQALLALCQAAAEEAVAWRHHFHEHPELSFQEFETTRYIEEKLLAFGGFQIVKVAPTGLMAVLKGKHPGKTIAFRADIDALPIQEDFRNEPRSKRDGVMHACGHDGHAAALLGAAKALSQLRHELRGELRFIFQPAEELQPGGAKDFVEKGALDGVDVIYGMHFQSQEEVGTFWLRKGAMLAGTYTFDIALRGKGTHAAFPHLGADTVLAAAQLIVALNEITARRIDPICRALLTVAAVNGGNSYNSLPEEVLLKGTLRILDSACEDALLAALNQTLRGIEQLFCVQCQLSLKKGYSAVENDSAAVDAAARILARRFGQASLHEPSPVMGGEDFSAYTVAAPGCYYRIGAMKRKPDGSLFPSHQSRHEINDDALLFAIRATVYLALET